jgi:AraC family transcriptional regulator, regulatory protein of adaptative response / methylated-DNA-[protein]-cysteine methyltransferase
MLTPLTSPFTQESHQKIEEWFTTHFGKALSTINDTAIVVDLFQSPIGPLVIGSVNEGICLVEFTDPERLESQVSTLRRWLPHPAYRGNHPYLEQLRRELTEYFAGERTHFEVPLVYPGSDFQRAVWNALLEIPYGETRSYEALARQVATLEAIRAVGGANGANRIAIVIPCHRVINKSGKLGGYGGGLWRKKALLALEQQQLTLQL